MAGYILPFIPYTRFMLGLLGWMMLLFEALLAMPLLALSLLKTDGEGFMTQNFQSGAIMILGIVLRPVLMIIGLVLGLTAFNGIMQIVSATFLPAIYNLSPGSNSENSILSTGIYLIIYGTFCYTLANAAFKTIDLLPNFVMSWLGARMEGRSDDAAGVQQQATGYMQTMAYSFRGGAEPGTAYDAQQKQSMGLGQDGGQGSKDLQAAQQLKTGAGATRQAAGSVAGGTSQGGASSPPSIQSPQSNTGNAVQGVRSNPSRQGSQNPKSDLGGRFDKPEPPR